MTAIVKITATRHLPALSLLQALPLLLMLLPAPLATTYNYAIPLTTTDTMQYH